MGVAGLGVPVDVGLTVQPAQVPDPTVRVCVVRVVRLVCAQVCTLFSRVPCRASLGRKLAVKDDDGLVPVGQVAVHREFLLDVFEQRQVDRALETVCRQKGEVSHPKT